MFLQYKLVHFLQNTLKIQQIMTLSAYMKGLSWWYTNKKVKNVEVTANLHVFLVEVGTISTEYPQNSPKSPTYPLTYCSVPNFQKSFSVSRLLKLSNLGNL